MNCLTAAPKPCAGFKRMPLNEKFLKHFPGWQGGRGISLSRVGT
jgi:hypothetical protein